MLLIKLLYKKEYNSDRRRKPYVTSSSPTLGGVTNKKEYNSDRRRKLSTRNLFNHFFKIRKNITPIGDGNELEQGNRKYYTII